MIFIFYSTVYRCDFKTHDNISVSDGVQLGDRMYGISAADCKERCQIDSRCTYVEYIEFVDTENMSTYINCQLYSFVSTTTDYVITSLFEKDCSSVYSGINKGMFLKGCGYGRCLES